MREVFTLISLRLVLCLVIQEFKHVSSCDTGFIEYCHIIGYLSM